MTTKMEWQVNTIKKRPDGTFIVIHQGYPYHVVSKEVDPRGLFDIKEVEKYWNSLPKTNPNKQIENDIPPFPGSGYTLNREENKWEYHKELDSPGEGYIFENDQWTQTVFTNMEFQFLLGIEKLMQIQIAIVDNPKLNAIWTMLNANGKIDVRNDLTKQILGFFTTEEYGSILTQKEVDEILKGKNAE